MCDTCSVMAKHAATDFASRHSTDRNKWRDVKVVRLSHKFEIASGRATPLAYWTSFRGTPVLHTTFRPWGQLKLAMCHKFGAWSGTVAPHPAKIVRKLKAYTSIYWQDSLCLNISYYDACKRGIKVSVPYHHCRTKRCVG